MMTDSEYFEQSIKDDAERVGIDTRGLVGMAIVHTMADEIERLRKLKPREWEVLLDKQGWSLTIRQEDEGDRDWIKVREVLE